MLSTFLLLSPIHKMNTGASRRDRATLPSPLRGLGPSGGYPSRLRSLRSLRAPLGPAVRVAHRRLPVRRCRVLRRHRGSSSVVFSLRGRCAPRASQASPRSPLPAAPSSGYASAPCHPVAASLRVSLTRRRSHSRTPSCALPRRGPPAHAPRRLTPVPIPEPFTPTFGTLVRVFSTPFGGSALTPHASSMPFPPASVVALPDGTSRNVSDLPPERFPALVRLPGRNAAVAASCTTPQPGGPHKEPPL